MTVGEFCNRQVIIAHSDERLSEVARRMRDFHVGALVVVAREDGRNVPIGILTDRDIVVRGLSGGGSHCDTLVVGEVMTRDVVAAQEGQNLWDAIKKMRSFGIRRLPVVNDRGGLEGILCFDDLIDVMAEEMSDLRGLVSREQKREHETIR